MSELGLLIRAKREREGLSLREAGEQSHVAFSTLARIERGATPGVKVYQAILAWLDGKAPVLPSPPLTKREWFAAHVPEWWMVERCVSTKIEWAYAYADAMIAASEGPKP